MIVKTSKDAIVGLSTDCNVEVITKRTDDVTKSESYTPQLTIEHEDVEKFGKHYPKVSDKLLKEFNKHVHSGTPKKVTLYFGEVNLKHRQTHPALEGPHKGKCAEWKMVDKVGKNPDGTTYGYQSPEWVGGEPKYSSATLGQLKDFATRVLQHNKGGIPMKDVTKAVNDNGYVIDELVLAEGNVKMAGHRCKAIAKAKAKAEKQEQDVKSGEAAKKNLEKDSELVGAAS
jgi:hypothetical protein|tara:strand:+ start:921 stop:1607 length:687 start_codon:yes stop_codon:yes gene_type:complete